MSAEQAFDYSVDLLRCIPWQYDSADQLISYIQSKQDWYDENHSQFWTGWFNNVFNLKTANDFGLAVWSIILDMPLYEPVSASDSGYPAFGFEFGMNFDNGNFATQDTSANNLTTEQKRILLRLRYYQLITDATIPSCNAIINDVFGEGVAYCLDGYDMTIRYVFTSSIDALLISTLVDMDLLPRAAGVKVITYDASLKTFGFADYGYNFDNGNFVGAY